MSILGPVPPYHVLALLQLRNVGHAEVLRIELHHLCTMQHLSTNVVHGNSNAKWVTLSHCGSLRTVRHFSALPCPSGACEIQTSVGFKWCPLDFFCFKLHLLRSPTTFAHHKTLQGSPVATIYFEADISFNLSSFLGSIPPTPLKNILNGDNGDNMKIHNPSTTLGRAKAGLQRTSYVQSTANLNRIKTVCAKKFHGLP